MKKNDFLISQIRNSKVIENDIIPYLFSDVKRYIYGNGLQAAVCLQIFKELDVDIEAIVLPPGIEKKCLKGYWGELLNSCNVVQIEEVNKEANVLLAICREDYDATKRMLLHYKIENVFVCCWEHNSDMLSLANKYRT